MSNLKLYFFGTPRITVDEQPIDLPRRKVMALLAYLAVTRQPHNRDLLATLLWPESSQQAARGALRRELHTLTKQLGTSWFSTSWEMVGIAPTAAIWSDVALFRQLATNGVQHPHDGSAICIQCQADLLAAIELYTGDFLAGFSLPDAEEFEAWQRFEAADLRRALAGALAGVIQWYRQQGNYSAAILHAHRWLALDTLHEPAHRMVMELYALAGDATAALRHYDECRQILQQELGVPPAAETTALYESIRNRRVVPSNVDAEPSHSSPASTALSPLATPTAQPRVPLIGRQLEWQQLQNAWSTAQQSGVHCVIVAGEAGIGKTRLAEEMVDWAGQQQIAAAQTRSYAAQGELAYAAVTELLRTKPFQECLHLLDDGLLTHLSRLWPELRTARPDLPKPEPVMDSWQRQQLFTALVQSCCVQARPLLLVFDDLQWADRETLEWLHYLVTTIRQRTAQTTIAHGLLLVGTMRTGEVDAGHPIYRLLGSFARDDCLTQINLSPLTLPAVQELANKLAPAPLDPALLDQLQRQTEGNPLFIVESIRTGLFQSGAEAATIAPGTALWLTERVPQLPPKAYAVIQTRLLQLSSQAQEVAALAAVIGRAFSFELISTAAVSPEAVLATAIDELWQRRILREQSAGIYDFDHARIRDVAYSEIGPARRRLLHRQVMEALENSEADRLDTISGELAAHCVQAGLIKRALTYYVRAAGTAQQLGAYEEGIALLQRGLALLPMLPETVERKAQELALLLQLGTLQRTAFGYAAQAHGQTLERANVLCRELNKHESLPHVLMGLYTHRFGRGAVIQSQSTAEALLTVVQQAQDPMALEEAYHAMGSHCFVLGDFPAAHHYFQQGSAVYDPQRHDHHIANFGFNLGCFTRAFDTHVLWMLDAEGEALQLLVATVAHARDLGHPFTLALVLAYGAMLHQFRGKPEAVEELTVEALTICRKHGIVYYEVWCTILQAWAVGKREQGNKHLAQLRQAIEQFRLTESGVRLPYYLSLLADLYLYNNQRELALATLAEAEEVAVTHGESWWVTEIYRLQAKCDDVG